MASSASLSGGKHFGKPLDENPMLKDCTLPREQLPTYDRAAVHVGIVHFGVGSFHRSHQAAVLDQLLRDDFENAKEWGICGVGVLDMDSKMRDVMTKQDGLYTLLKKAPGGSWDVRVIGSIVEYLFAPDDSEAVLQRMADPATRIVSLTITEGGYGIDSSGKFDTNAKSVQDDVAAGKQPKTAFGLITEALMRRKAAGTPPFTVQSCDNIESNGDIARHAISAFAGVRDKAFGEWMQANVKFPNSMVDRIAPGTTPQDVTSTKEQYGIDDAWPAACEDFFRWALEDTFTSGRPKYEAAGVQVTEDVAPFEKMKLRLLNASHSALGLFGTLCGYEYAHEAARDVGVRAFVRGYMDHEATPTLDPVAGQDLEEYKGTLLERFGNAAIGDKLARLAGYSSDKIPKFLVPVVHENVRAGRSLRYSAAVIAAWARYAEGTDEQGQKIDIVDLRAEEMTGSAKAQRESGDPHEWLQARDLFGDLADEKAFVNEYESVLHMLWEKGARHTVHELAAGR